MGSIGDKIALLVALLIYLWLGTYALYVFGGLIVLALIMWLIATLKGW